MNNMYKKLKALKEMGIWFNRVPTGERTYTWVSMYEGKRVEKGVMFWPCVRNTWLYVESLKQKVQENGNSP